MNSIVKKTCSITAAALGALALPFVTFAHEVYVLSPQEIQQAINTPSVSPWIVIQENIGQFSFWTFISVLIVFIIFFVSISRRLEKWLDPFFARTKHWAPVISRVTVGISFLAGAYYQASYGPELPLAATYGVYTPFVTVILVVIGLCMIFSVYERVAAIIALIMYGIAVYHRGWYMLTYTNYLGEFIALLILGSMAGRGALARFARKLEPYIFTIIRVLFGTALIYTSWYAKLLYSNLALDTVNFTDPAKGIMYPLTHYLHFSPPFLVLGAACVEIVIGLFFIFGIEIRFTAIFLLFWLTMSLIHFGEIVWPHIILIGIPIAFIFHGYDKTSLEGYFFKKGKREPVM